MIKSRKRVIDVERVKRVFATMFAGRPMQFPSRSPRSYKKTRTHCLTLSESAVSRERSTSRKRIIRDQSRHGSILRQSRRFFLIVLARERLVNIWSARVLILLELKRVSRPERSVWFCSKRLIFSQKKRKRRQECSDYCENQTTIGMCITLFRCAPLSR